MADHDVNMSDVGNPISVIKNKLHMLRKEKDITETDIESLMHEKEAIRNTLPKLLHVLIQHRDNIAAQNREIMILDKAIKEIENTYGHILYSVDFYDNDEEDEHRGRSGYGGRGRGGRDRKNRHKDDENSDDNNDQHEQNDNGSDDSSTVRKKKKQKEKNRNRKYRVH